MSSRWGHPRFALRLGDPDWLSDGKLRIDCQKGSASGWLLDGIWGETSGSQFGVPHLRTNLGGQLGANLGCPHLRANLGSSIWEAFWGFQSGSQSGAAHLGANLGRPIWQPIFEANAGCPHLGAPYGSHSGVFNLGRTIWEPILGCPIWD